LLQISNYITGVTPKNFITTLANKGISVRVLASLAGHKSIAVTQKYIDTNDDMKRNAVELI
jgi:integrase/recombinase XerD